ncbi:MAG: hypothetical protein LAN83_14785 [Acidobacteriia bacterium]|nr:hypothetical protein [Terriglobia bacterium]
MPKFWVLLLSIVFLLGSLGSLSCGSMNNNQRLLQSIMVTPAAADAQNFPNGQVPFTATGNYSAPPTPASVFVATWCVHDSNGCMGGTPGATVDANGLAQCDSGFIGTVEIAAIASNGAGAPVRMGDTGAAVAGTAQLTCP